MSKVFLGGTWNGTTWRNKLIPNLKINYFNPVVEDWTPQCQLTEEIEKENKCNIHLYIITSDMTGVFSIAEAINSSHNKNKYTIFQVMPDGFGRGQLKSLEAVINMVKQLGQIAFLSQSLDATIEYCNNL